MLADPFKSTRTPLGDGRYRFVFLFGSGVKVEFDCYPHEWKAQLDWRMAGNEGLSPKILADREAQEERLRYQLIQEDPELQYNPELYYGRPSEYLARREEGPSGLSIAERKRLAKLKASYPKP